MAQVRRKGGGSCNDGRFGHGNLATPARVPPANPATSMPPTSAADDDLNKALWVAQVG